MAQIVARRVGAVLRELLAEAEVRRAVQAGHKAVDDRLRQQVERGDAGQHLGIEKALQHQLSFGRGTCAINCRENFVGIDAIGLGMKVEQHAMAQHRHHHRRNVLVGHVVALMRERARLGGQHDELRGAHAGAVVDIFLTKSGARRSWAAWRAPGSIT